MVIGNIVKPGKLKSHKYAQCYWAECIHKNKLTFFSYESDIFTVVETEYGLTFYPRITSHEYSRNTEKHMLWALYEIGYDYKIAHKIIDGLRAMYIVKA